MNLQPDPTAMQQFLDHLFGDAAEGRVELAWTDAGDDKLRHARTFSLDDLEARKTLFGPWLPEQGLLVGFPEPGLHSGDLIGVTHRRTAHLGVPFISWARRPSRRLTFVSEKR